MEVEYRLAESTILVDGTIERVADSFTGTGGADDEEADVEVRLGVRGDEGAGQQVVVLASRGDDDFGVELTADQRLRSLSYKSAGIGSRVVVAGTTVLATVAGVALRVAGAGAGGGAPAAPGALQQPAADPRARWREDHEREDDHWLAYEAVLADATAALLEARRRLVAADDPAEMSALVVRIHRLEAVAADARREIERVKGLFRLWRESFRTRRTEARSFSLSVDALPEHDPEASLPDVAGLTGTALDIWEGLGVLVEIGAADGRGSHRVPAGAGDTKRDGEGRVRWRLPRPVRLWVWRRGSDGRPALERSFQAAVVDRYSGVRGLTLRSSLFGVQGGSLAFDDLGVPSRLSFADRSGAGALAEALGSVPASVTAGLEQAAKLSGAVGTLTDAGAARRLAVLQRQVAERTKELELKGLEATADDFAELKRLEQQVALAKAGAALAAAPDGARA